ncbi:MAG TPA: hypothetical protein PLT75_04255 [Spirochaetota bacterium]|nr:hypothetical protein [Spirochaetota bacterium]
MENKIMDHAEYKNEIRKLKKNRKRYRPALQKLINLYDQRLAYDSSIEITNPDDIALFAELLDIGYIDYEALSVTTRFGDIRAMAYTFRYPLTESGMRYMEEKGLHSLKEYRTFLLVLLATILLFGAAVFLMYD